MNAFPGNQHTQHGNQSGQQYKEHAYTVYAQGIVDIEGSDPVVLLPELHQVGAFIKEKKDGQNEEQLKKADHQGNKTHGLDFSLYKQEGNTAEHRKEDENTEQRHGYLFNLK